MTKTHFANQEVSEWDCDQKLSKENTIFFNEKASAYTLKHMTKSNYYCAIGKIRKDGSVFYFQELKNCNKQLPIVAGGVSQSVKLFQYLEQVADSTILIKGQLCELSLSGEAYEFNFGLCPYIVELNPCEYFDPQLILSLSFDSWNKKDWDFPTMNANIWPDVVKEDFDQQTISGIRMPTWMLSFSETHPKWLKDCFVLAECSLLDYFMGISIDNVLAICGLDGPRGLGDDMFDCQFMLRESSRTCISGFACFKHKVSMHNFCLNKHYDELENINNEPSKSKKNKRKSISDKLRRSVFERDNFTCCDCGASPHASDDVELHVDHRIPVALGGKNTLENLQTLCKSCNLGKGIDIDWKLDSKEVHQAVAA